MQSIIACLSQAVPEKEREDAYEEWAKETERVDAERRRRERKERVAAFRNLLERSSIKALPCSAQLAVFTLILHHFFSHLSP